MLMMDVVMQGTPAVDTVLVVIRVGDLLLNRRRLQVLLPLAREKPGLGVVQLAAADGAHSVVTR